MACDTRMIGSWQEEEGICQNRDEHVWQEALWSDKEDFKMKFREGSRECTQTKLWRSGPAHIPLAPPYHLSALTPLLCAWESDHTSWIIGLLCLLFVLHPWDPPYRNSLSSSNHTFFLPFNPRTGNGSTQLPYSGSCMILPQFPQSMLSPL